MRRPGGAQPLKAAQHTRGDCHAHAAPLPPSHSSGAQGRRLSHGYLPPCLWWGLQSGQGPGQATIVFKDSSVPACGPHASPFEHLNTVPGHCDQLTGLECLAMTRAKADSLCLAWWACPTLFRGTAHSAQPLSEQGQSASEFAFCYSVTVVYGKSIPRSAVESKAHHRPCPGPWILSACPAAAGAARSPGKPSVSCQRET